MGIETSLAFFPARRSKYLYSVFLCAFMTHVGCFMISSRLVIRYPGLPNLLESSYFILKNVRVIFGDFFRFNRSLSYSVISIYPIRQSLDNGQKTQNLHD